ncbi:hypothetical protein Pmani_015515 [Petrolisthes manimaculis]|uniref:Uncharacterized protein n=1 Tax=Petrolisthes manimaculis TaxID=1843537 RepID=A0AAE1U9T3_9EUCA|nr:hypothetical protein Pmani_015515 [Petrolisthes manimaculis]
MPLQMIHAKKCQRCKWWEMETASIQHHNSYSRGKEILRVVCYLKPPPRRATSENSGSAPEKTLVTLSYRCPLKADRQLPVPILTQACPKSQAFLPCRGGFCTRCPVRTPRG